MTTLGAAHARLASPAATRQPPAQREKEALDVNPQDDLTAAFSDDEPGPPRPLWGPAGTSGARPTTAPKPTGPPPVDSAAAAPTYPPPPDLPPLERPHPPPPGRSTTNSSTQRTGLIIGLAVAAVLILTTVVVIVQQTLTPSTTATTPLSPTISNGGGFTTDPTSTPPPAIGTSLVQVTSTAASSPYAAAVAALLDRHFTAINQHDYTSWSSTVVSQRANDQSAAAWQKGYQSTNDDSVVVTSISGDSTGLTVNLSFRSTQQPSDAPANLQVTRVCWESRWPVVDISNGGRIATPPKGTTTYSAC